MALNSNIPFISSIALANGTSNGTTHHPHFIPTPEQINELTLEGLFHYLPNDTMCFVAVAIFLVSGMFVTIVSSRLKNWLLMFISLTTILEILGYMLRYACIKNPAKLKFTAMSIFLVVGPNFLALVNYVVIGTLAQRYQSGAVEIPVWMNARGVSMAFLSSDILSFILQGVAVIELSVSSSDQDPTFIGGLKLLEAGFGIQLIFFTFFLILVIYVNKSKAFLYNGNSRTQPIFAVLYVTISCLYLRAIYRLIQFIDATSYITVHEPFYYVFDGLMVLICVLMYAFFPVARYLPPVDDEETPNPKSHSLEVVKSTETTETENDNEA